jgi:ABC-type transport system involved in Fe-S cluster assembly fused permease/ATPase subunit
VIFEEIKTVLFTHVSQTVLRKFAHEIFRHMHTLDTDFHLSTPSGVISVAYVRAVRGFQTTLFQLVFSVAPTLLELALVVNILSRKFSPVFAGLTLTTFITYLIFTIFLTQQRVKIRRELVDTDNVRNGFFIDSILNQEVVKLFNSERKELNRFDEYLKKIQQLNVDTTFSIALLNCGQAFLFGTGLVISLLVALHKVLQGKMSVGDLVAVNSMLLQLAIPFDFIGYTCKFERYNSNFVHECVCVYV